MNHLWLKILNIMFEMIRKEFGVVFGIVKRIKILIINNWINVIIIIIGIIWVFYSSNSSLNDNYFYASFADIISTVVVLIVGITYAKSQDKRNYKRALVEKFISDILSMLEKEELDRIESTEKYDHVRVLQRAIKNKMDLLQSHQEVFNYKEELTYCMKNFSEYWETVSENNNNINVLIKERSSLKSKLENISFKLNYIHNKLAE